MFKTKLEVDRHVDNSLKKINNETERKLRCCSFAKLYFNVGDYEQACRYVSTYLSVKPKSAEGHNLLGKALEKLGKKEAALEAYRTSLQIDPKQNNLVIKVCELLASDDVETDRAGAKYFCEMAQQLDPHNPAVYSLREKLITLEDKNPSDISQLLLKELESRPADVNLRVKLLKHFLQNNMIKEAYKHASDIEEKNLSIFHGSLAWYEVFAEVLVRFQRDLTYSSQITWEFWFLSVSVLDRLVALSLDEHIENVKTTNDYINNTFNFDQMLTNASSNIANCPDRTLIQTFLNHYQAQLNLHFATLFFKQAKKDLMGFKEVSNVALPLLFCAYHSSPPDTQSLWFNNLPENRRKLVNHWHKESCYRCSQTGHILLAFSKERKSILIEKATQYSTGMWREQLFKKLFVKRDQHLKMGTSFFVSNTQNSEPVIKLPEPSDLAKYDEIAQFVHPDSLHHHIWIAMNSKISDYVLKCFEGLQYSIKNLNNCAAESLNVLDVQSFVYLATLCAQNKNEENKSLIFYNQDKPSVLPASITDNLGTLNQSKFVASAYKMYKNEYSSNMGELRLLLIKGIEVVRCAGNHGLDVKLLVTLANIFSERAKILTKQSEIEANDARAELYWKTALPLLENLKNNKMIVYPRLRLFEYRSKELSINEINTYIEKGKLFTALQLMKKKEYERALHIFENLKDPYASFYQSQIYKHMADQKTNQNKENLTSEMRSQNIILLSKARDCLYLTLDRLREPSADRDHPLNSQLGTEIEKIERLLSRIDPDCNNRNECEGMSDENVSSDNSAGDHYITTFTTHTSFNNGHNFTPKHENHNHSTPLRFNVARQEARPSPERLDAQLRQIIATRDSGMNSIMEQNRIMLDSHKSLLEELRGFKDAVNHLTSAVDDLKSTKSGLEEVKKSVDELRNSVDEVHNVVDIVHELKKEINELKKDKDKNNQLSEEDLSYVLDSDCGLPLDYNINPNPMNYAPNVNQMYAHFPPQPRLPIPTSLAAAYGAAGLYPGLYPGLAYPFGLGLPQPGALPFLQQDQQIPPISTALPQQNIGYAPPLTSNLVGQNLTQTPPSTKPLIPNVVTTSQSLFTPAVTTTSKALPVNVVITSSDPLPTTKTTTSQPVLSVTIPPQHIKGNKPQAHSYQIPLPTSNLVTSPSVLNKPAPVVSTQSLLSNVAPPMFSAVAQSKPATKNISLGQQIEKTLDQTFSPTKNDGNISNVSSASIEEHDAMPDFKPIIPLPDEVPVNTGEENEIELFCERAKLYRHVNKEWKERGVGNLKILHNPVTGKVRILMRRDQVHKICANHFLTKEMAIAPMTKNDRAYIWAAHDFADEEMKLEKFCVRFKTPEEANKFFEAFEEAKKKIDDKLKKKVEVPMKSLGGFVFTAAPEFKPKELVVKPIQEEKKEETSTSKPFANISFGTHANNLFSGFKPFESNTTFSPVVIPQKEGEENDSHAEEFVPTAEFQPVVALPELIEVKTGEENAEVLFEERAKLFRYDTTGESKEWKERGVGVMKILKEDNIRLVMRRDQVHKVCCNHQVFKDMVFKKNSNNPKAVIWHAQDFSEGVLKPETFTVRFKTEEQATQFLKIIQTAQTSLDESNQVSKKHHKPEPVQQSPKLGFGDKFKPAKGSWECKNCYIVNEAKTTKCSACDTPKSGKNSEESGAAFSFSAKEGDKPSFGWGNAFKPAEGSWECKMCFVRNPSDKLKCISCETTKEGVVLPKEPPKSISLDTGGQKFTFGIPLAAKPEENKKEGFGDAFKPKEGTWECKMCLVRNPSDKLKCLSCETTKEGTVLPKEPLKGISLDTGGQKFMFGIPPATKKEENKNIQGFGDGFKPKEGTWECKVCYVRNDSNRLRCLSCDTPKETTGVNLEATGVNVETTGQKIIFGIPTTNFANKTSLETPETTTFSFAPTEPINVSDQQKDAKFVFGSPQKHDFEFKPRSPRKISTGQGEESDNSYYQEEEEEDNIYFKPVVPLPEKVEVKTGEEEEDVLYCHRAKLFRFVDGEWKERGLGDIKVLKQKSNGKLRVVMRREQVLKICLNHCLTKDIEYIPKDEKTWLFSAPDFSEGEISRDRFCIRFKNQEIAQEFKKAIDEAVEVKEISGETGTTSNDDDEVIIVSETKVTPEEEKEALRLGLPPKFFAYRQLPDCTCEQCKKDDEFLKELFNDNKKPPEKSASTSVVSTPSTASFLTPTGPNFTFSAKKESVETPKDLTKSATVFNFSKPVSNTPELTLKELLQTPSKLTTLESPSTNFSFKPSALVTTPSVFGGTTTSTNIFGATSSTNNSSTPQSSSPFSTSKTSLFGSGTSVFGSAQSISSTSSIFGSSNQNSSIFGGNSVSSNTTPSVFGGTTTAGTSILTQGSNLNTPTTTSNIFGAKTVSGSIFGSSTAFSTPTTTNIFGGATGTIFGGGAPIFGSKNDNKATEATLTFGSVVKDGVTTKLKEDDEVVLKSEPGLTFSALAAGTSPDAKPLFAQPEKEEMRQPFAFLGAGAPVFGGKKAEKKEKSRKESETEEGGENEEHDPHFEPIIALPDEITVSTGEEDETALFNERAKLYRYDVENKEWKERGVGQLKILHHPKHETYRLLLRREQVHKIVLNQLIRPDLEVQPMMTSDKAWMWAGYNYTDDENKLEKLAVRLKNTELAGKFKEAIDTAICRAIEIQNRRAGEQPVKDIPTSVVNYGIENISGSEENEPTVQIEEIHDGDDYDEDDEDEDEDDEDERSLMFEKNCTLSEQISEGQWQQITSGILQVYYDPCWYAARICVYDDDKNLQSNTLIGMNTQMNIDKNECTWRAVEWAQGIENWRDLKATFSTNVDAQEFHSNYLEGINYAQEIGILDELPVAGNSE